MKTPAVIPLCLLLAMAAAPALAGEPTAGEPSRQSQPAQAQDLNSQIEALRKAQEEDHKKQQEAIEALRAKIDALEKAKAEPAPPTSDAKGGAPRLGLVPQSALPDISLNADFLAHYSSHDATDDDKRKFRVREVELGFSGAVDPYGKYNLVFSLSEDKPDQWGVDVEEAYFTFDQLPGDLQAKVGKFRADFGKANPTHLHAVPWIDYPLVVRNYFGDEGLKGTGASVSWLVPNPWDHYMELTGEVFDNDNETLFAGEQSTATTGLLHLKNFWDVGPTDTLEFGLSAAGGPNDAGHGGENSWIEGADLTYRWHPAGAGRYEALELRGEVMTAQKDEPDTSRAEDSWGAFASAEYQFAQRWAVGTRYDYAETPDDHRDHENAYSAYLTFKQTEFAFWRLDYTFENPNYGPDRESGKQEIFLQFNITLGVHPAHQY
jgi:hypothetical protein